MFIGRNDTQMGMHEGWLKSVEALGLDSRLLSAREIAQKVPGGRADWAGGIFTPSDARAEPTLAASAIAGAAIAKGAVVVENCAVRTLVTATGRISGVVTEQGEIRCDQVLLAGGLWSRKFLGNLGINLPTLPLTCSVLRTEPMDGPTDIAVGAPGFRFASTRTAVTSSPSEAHWMLSSPSTTCCWASVTCPSCVRSRALRISFGKYFFKDLALARRWKATDVTPFERVRVQDPHANPALNDEAMRNLKAAWPVFEQARIASAWAGTIDVTPTPTR